MKKTLVVILMVWSSIAYLSFNSVHMHVPSIPYPEGYREWTHIKSGIVGAKSPAAPKYEGFTHIYANAKAMEGYRTGKFPEGSVIVFDVLELQPGETGTAEGKRKFIDVMIKDSRQFEKTGGWGYGEFDKDDHSKEILTETMRSECTGCHNNRKANDYIFSSFRP